MIFIRYTRRRVLCRSKEATFWTYIILQRNCMLKLTTKKRMELRRLAERPDSEIDLTDIPEILDLPSDAVIGRFYRSNKEGVTMRLDAGRS